jgi:tRNA-splicing ligase RtcB
VKRFFESGLSGADPQGRVTLRFDYAGAGPIEVSQLDDRGVDDAVSILTSHDIAHPVVRLRPFAVLN